MGFFKSSKKEIPSELPDLALGAPQKQQSSDFNHELDRQPIFPEKPQIKQVLQEQPVKNIQGSIQTDSPADDEKGFFKELINNLVKETKNIDKIESFYNNKFMEEDIISQMRSYWEEQKPDILLKNVGKDLRDKIELQSGRLHKLEREWQDTYFALLSKEEEIRSEEKELKETISEFISVCKKTGRKNKRN